MKVSDFLKIFLINLVTNAVSELSHLTLRMYKSILQATMSQERLKSLILLTIDKRLLDDLNLTTIENKLSYANGDRHSVFGTFNTRQCMQFDKEIALCVYSNVKRNIC